MRKAKHILEMVKDRGERRLPLERVYRLLRNKELFLEAYGKLAPNKGALTAGVNPEDTVDGMSIERIDRIIAALKDRKYRWTPVKRVYIPKRSGRMRPLGLPSFNDKLVQEVLRRILEAYYEPQFSDASHGFRPNRGCHTALMSIKNGWGGVRWFIEGDIRGCFDHINHDTLLEIIGKNIHDEPTLRLLKGMLEAGYMEQWVYHETYSGTPQGGVLSPLLANIVLNELDQYVERELMPHYNKGTWRGHNPEYLKLGKQMRRAKDRNSKETYRQLLEARRTIPSRDTNDPEYRRLKYIRYADDFVRHEARYVHGARAPAAGRRAASPSP